MLVEKYSFSTFGHSYIPAAQSCGLNVSATDTRKPHTLNTHSYVLLYSMCRSHCQVARSASAMQMPYHADRTLPSQGTHAVVHEDIGTDVVGALLLRFVTVA